MKLYQLHIAPAEYDSDGLIFDEYFGSLAAAKRRRAELIRETSPGAYKFNTDYQIDEIILAALPTKQLVLAALNGKGYVHSRRIVVEEYKVPRQYAPESR